MSVASVGSAYGLISFKSYVMRDNGLKNNSDWILKWFLDVKRWEFSDLAYSSHGWVCLKGVAFPYWHCRC